MNPQLAENFHRAFYTEINWRKDLSYCGVPILKNPLDLFVEQEIIWDTRPDIIIETGTAHGGSALYYSHLLEKLGGNRFVVTIDIESSRYEIHQDALDNSRILFLDQGSLDVATFDKLKSWIGPEQKTMVILDSDHHYNHVSAELKAYSPFVTNGCYLIVEDTNTDLVLEGYGPSGKDAVDEFLNHHVEFANLSEENSKFGFSFNSWLRRIK